MKEVIKFPIEFKTIKETWQDPALGTVTRVGKNTNIIFSNFNFNTDIFENMDSAKDFHRTHYKKIKKIIERYFEFALQVNQNDSNFAFKRENKTIETILKRIGYIDE